jgi:16S rRNA (cytidine1402-2'-O)-methyltransferase
MLYICPTPIGNLGDITLRCIDVLKQADLIACEDTRHSKVLLTRYGITSRLVSFHDYNEEQRLQVLLPLLRDGKDVAVVSDAGMPGLSDPGFTLVRACAAEGIPVTVLPGASAVSTALVLSGLPVDRFAFVGFLARGRSKLLEQLTAFEGTGAALVAFESPRRIRPSLAIIAERWPARPVVVCRELTKIHEEALRGTAGEVLARLPEPVRGEIVVVLGASGAPGGRRSAVSPTEAGAAHATPTGEVLAAGELEQRAREALAELQHLGVGTKQAAGLVARLTGIPGKSVYRLALDVKSRGLDHR